MQRKYKSLKGITFIQIKITLLLIHNSIYSHNESFIQFIAHTRQVPIQKMKLKMTPVLAALKFTINKCE